MSGFSARWLALREAADHRSRHDFTAKLDVRRPNAWTVVDLGCGTGSNLRYLQPRLGGEQHWTCVDDDALLLQTLQERSRESLDAHGGLDVSQTDLAAAPGALIEAHFPGGEFVPQRLVTASALLDLVCAGWIDAVVAAATRARVAVWLALSYDGRIELDPGHGLDTGLRSRVNAHQLTDKGFGPALGPQAHAHACASLTRAGFTVHEATSDWVLTGADAPLVRELLSGWLDAARELTGEPALLADWQRLRLSQLEAGSLQVRVGHRDLLALPRDSTQAL